MASFLVRTGRRLEDQRDHALHVLLNRRARTIVRIELAKRLRRRWIDLRAGLRRTLGQPLRRLRLGVRRLQRLLARDDA